MADDTVPGPENRRNSPAPVEREKEYFSVRLTVSGAARDYEDPREAGAAFFRADPAERPSVVHVEDDSARIMARTTMLGTDETGEARYGKTLPDSHAPDATFRAGFHEAMETSLSDRPSRADREANGKSIEPRLDARLKDDLEAFAEREPDKAAALWTAHSAEIPPGPRLKFAVETAEPEAERDGRTVAEASAAGRPNVIATAPWVRTDQDVELRGVAVATEKGIHTGYEASLAGGESGVTHSELTFPSAGATLKHAFDFYEGDEKGLETAVKQYPALDPETENDRPLAPSALSIQHQDRPEFPRPETAIYAGEDAQLIVTLGRDTPATRALADGLAADPDFRNIVRQHIPDADTTLGTGRFTDGDSLVFLPSEVMVVARSDRDEPGLARFPDESPLSLALARHLTESPVLAFFANEQRESSPAPMSRADFRSHVEDWMERVGGKMRDLSAETQAELRPEFNDIAAKAMEVMGDRRGAELAREGPKSTLYRSALAADTPILDGEEARISAARTARLREALGREAEAAGLDGAAVAKRIGAGATSALEEREWVKADIASVAATKGFDLDRETNRAAAAGIVDRFYERASGMINAARGVRVENAAEELRTTLSAMAKMEERQGQVRFESDADAQGLVEDMKARYGETIIKDLAQGRTDALARDFADTGERAKIAEAVTSAARDHEPFGLSPKEAEAAHDRLTRRQAVAREPSRDNDHDRER